MRRFILLLIVTVSFGVTADESGLLLNSEVLSEGDMATSRGGQYNFNIDNIQATSDIDGVSSGNTAMNNLTGNNVITAGSLSNVSGITSVIQNSGNNVLIQNATVVNLTLK